ncbi:ADP-ribosylation factor 2-like protein [Auriculariales sp. MPI-PUGE-AT-0066]|nr:ADP-ribosylation factor 2-like protein [Auriculariales sp. MPI-PUGE-AT-0066]
MGSHVSRLSELCFRKPTLRILMTGLDGAGKTTLMQSLKLGEIAVSFPTIGFQVETVSTSNFSISAFDFDGSLGIQYFWRSWMNTRKVRLGRQDFQGVIVVVDSASDRPERFEKQTGLCIKTLRNALSVAHVAEKLKLQEIPQKWSIEPISAFSGEPWRDIMNWLTNIQT